MLPVISIMVETTSHICAQTFFDPIPTLWHVIMVVFVPLAHFQVWLAVDKGSTERPVLLGLANAAAIGISACYTIVYLPLLPLAFAALVLMGLGLLRGTYSDTELTGPANVLRVERAAEVTESWTRDSSKQGGEVIRQFIREGETRVPSRVVLVVDTSLGMKGQGAEIDAPCSGVRMLWVGLFLVCVLAAVYDLRPLRTLYSVAAAFVVIIFGNVFRAVALFYLEAKVVEMPSWSHEYVGVVAFVVIAAGIVLIVRRMREGEKLCAQPLSI